MGSSDDLDIPHINLEEQQVSMEMEEAAQHAMTIVEGAQKFTEEAAKEQEIKGDHKKAYKEQLSLSPNDVHLPTNEAAPSATPAAAPSAAPVAAPSEATPPSGGQPAPPPADNKPY